MKRFFLASLMATTVLAGASSQAAQYDLREQTPAVAAALANRQQRYDALKQMKAAGVVGEDNQGHVARLGGGSEVAELVAEENTDREVVYRAIVEQNGLPSEAITIVRQVFAETQREKASASERLQLPSGEWMAK